MNWKYHIPHTWESPRGVWEDVWLLPDDPNYKGESIWLTIDAFGDVSDPDYGSERADFQKEALKRLGDKQYWIGSGEMIVRATDFTKDELLHWVKVWLEETGFIVSSLREAPIEEFADTNEQARIIMTLHDKYGSDQRLMERFSAEQMETLCKLRISTVMQLCSVVRSSEDSLDLISHRLQMPRDDLRKLVNELFDSLSVEEQQKLTEFRPKEKGMGLRKRREDE